MAVVGCGRWGRNHVRNYAELGALEGLVDHHPEVVTGLIAQHGGRALTFEEALADERVHALAFALPPAQHHPLGRRALVAGKHVFLEKPMSLDVAGAEDLGRIAEERGLTLMVGHILQYHPVFAALRTLVRSGDLGRVQHVTSRRLALGRIRRPEDALWELAPHDVSMVLSLLDAEPTAVEAVGAYHLHPAIADRATLHLAFAGEATAEIAVSWLHPVKEHKLIVVGSEGMAVFDDGEPWERKLIRHPHRIAWQGDLPVAEPGEPVPVEVPHGEPLREECRHFLDCVRTGAPPLTDAAEGVRVLRVLERASAAMGRRGRPETI